KPATGRLPPPRYLVPPYRSLKQARVKLFNNDGVNPVVVNSMMNNGVGGYTNRPTTEPGQIITFSDTTTSEAIFYQAAPFVGYPHVQGLYPKGSYATKWNEFSLLFFMTGFRKVAELRNFTYGDKFTRVLAAEFLVPLPVTYDGDPNWDHMERVMRDQLTRQESKLDALLAIDAAMPIGAE
ncbi:restriction endonuclease subunit S, partial [Corynebacterium sp. KPL2734]|uniref:restriction endonuclease subunit S n=1 Tax=Corynebacterium sp. KPL2734 TaxID=3158312 RepID=UPI0032ED801B